MTSGPVEMAPDGGAVETEPWREDGTGTQHVDGSPATCDAAFNRGYDVGYCEGMKAGAPPVRVPRWDQDPVVLRFGWNDGTRCGNCGEPRPVVSSPAQVDGETARIKAQALDEAADALENARQYTWNAHERKINGWSTAAQMLRHMAQDYRAASS